jgi:hypothetical protein
MTAPIPPSKPPPAADPSIAALVLASSEKQLAEMHQSHALTLVIIAIASIVVFALTGKSIGDAQNAVKEWKAKADTAVTAAAYWKVREYRARDSMRVHRAADSVQGARVQRYAIPVQRVVHDVRVVHDTVHDQPTSVQAASAVPLPEPPPGQPLVLASVFDAQGKACTRERHDCDAALAAADSAKAYLQKLAFDRQDETKATQKLYGACERRDLRDKIIFGVGGIVVGFGVGAAHP